MEEGMLAAFLYVMFFLHTISSAEITSIFLLARQSNMSGRGGVINNTKWDGVVPPECQPNSTILRLRADLTWEEAHEPLHQDIDVKKVCGVGPGMPFANSVLKRDPGIGVIGLVPCAIGGTSISQWSRGTDLYNQLLRRAEVAVKGGGTIRAILWYQGEADTWSPEAATLYKSRLQHFIKDVRSDLPSPLLPVIEVALASGNATYIDIVRKAQLETPAELLNVKCVDAKGLPLEPDEVHLTTPAQVRLGEMMADAYLQI